MLYREIIAVCSEIHTKHVNTAVWAERRIFEPLHTVVYTVTSGLQKVEWRSSVAAILPTRNTSQSIASSCRNSQLATLSIAQD